MLTGKKLSIVNRSTKKLVWTLISMLSIGKMKLHAQGCSDAGFCSVGNLSIKNVNSKNQYKNEFTISLTAGNGDKNISVITHAFQYKRKLSVDWYIEGKITGNTAKGNLGSAAGLGDIFLLSTYVLTSTDKWKFSGTAGAKFPLSLSNEKVNGLSLPMQYQSSLGTVDIILGGSAYSKNWLFAVGLQQPVTKINQNGFLPSLWKDNQAAAKYSPSNNFYRKGDILLRTTYQPSISSGKWSGNVGLLAIFHLLNDTYTSPENTNKPITLQGSQGLTLNATSYIHFKLNEKVAFGLTGGIPIIVRDIRPDGLTRSWVVSPEVNIKF